MKTGILAVFLLIFTVSTQHSARADDDSVPQSDDAQKTERIEVTGSHIKRIDTEGVAPVETVTHEELEKKGYDNLGDVVRDLGVNSFGSDVAPQALSSTPGMSDVNLRGLGGDNTLVLLNGQRLPQDAIQGTVDINLIPMAAVERIEILKDGASAVYGSDALGGVVNIITRKDFQGTEFTATQNLPTNYGDGKQTRLGLVNGINTEKLNIVTSLNYMYNQAVFSANRPWSNTVLSQTGYPGSYQNQTPTPAASGPPQSNDTPDGNTFSPSTCPPGLLLTTPAGQWCQFNTAAYNIQIPLVNQLGGMTEIHYEVSSDVRAYARLGYTWRGAEDTEAPSPGFVIIPNANVAQFGLPNIKPGDDLQVNVRLLPLGNRVTDTTTNAYNALGGVTIQLPKDWQLDLTANYNLVNNSGVGVAGFAYAPAVQTAIQNGTFNPFLATPTAGSLAGAQYIPFTNTQSMLVSAEAKASGDVTELPAGPMGMALGTLVNYSSYNEITDSQSLAGNVFGSGGGVGSGHRTSEAIYSELSVPLVKKTLEAQVAARFDNYSDFGNTINPKLGLLFHATPNLLFRTSAGTGFRAPLLTELYAGQQSGYQTFIDHVACNSLGGIYCTAQQYYVTSNSNPNLADETSFSYTAGAVYEPLPVLNFGADFFYTKISNTPGINYEDLTTAILKGVNPAQYGVIVTRNNGVIQSIYAPLQNLSQTNEMGIDLTGAYTYNRFKLQTEQNQFFTYYTEGFPGAGLINKIGWNSMPSWRNTTTLSYVPADAHYFGLTARTIPSQLTLDRGNSLSPLTTFDFSYVYKTKSYGDFSFGVINILNSAPPIDNSDPTQLVNYTLYDPNGRQVVFGYKKAL